MLPKVASSVHKDVCMFKVKIYKGLVSVRIKKFEKEGTMLRLNAYYVVAVALDSYDFEAVFCPTINFDFSDKTQRQIQPVKH